jgi:hypothetical protein
MNTAPTPVTLAWGALPGGGQHQIKVATTEELTAALDHIHAEVLARGLAQQVDAMTQGRTITPYGEPDPLVQVLLGHPDRGSVRWNEGDDCFQAIDPDLPPLPEPIIYDNGGAADPMDPEYTRLSPASTRQILNAFLLTGKRPTDVTWISL